MPNQLNKKKKTNERKTNASNQFTIEMRNDLKWLCVCVFVLSFIWILLLLIEMKSVDMALPIPKALIETANAKSTTVIINCPFSHYDTETTMILKRRWR